MASAFAGRGRPARVCVCVSVRAGQLHTRASQSHSFFKPLSPCRSALVPSVSEFRLRPPSFPSPLLSPASSLLPPLYSPLLPSTVPPRPPQRTRTVKRKLGGGGGPAVLGKYASMPNGGEGVFSQKSLPFFGRARPFLQ